MIVIQAEMYIGAVHDILKTQMQITSSNASPMASYAVWQFLHQIACRSFALQPVTGVANSWRSSTMS